MARPPKKKPTGGRVTPKASGGHGDGPYHPGASTRYTPPIPADQKISAPWVAPVMFALLALGVLVIVLNYLGVLLPGATDNWYLLVGLAFILGGIVTATQLH